MSVHTNNICAKKTFAIWFHSLRHKKSLMRFCTEWKTFLLPPHHFVSSSKRPIINGTHRNQFIVMILFFWDSFLCFRSHCHEVEKFLKEKSHHSEYKFIVFSASLNFQRKTLLRHTQQLISFLSGGRGRKISKEKREIDDEKVCLRCVQSQDRRKKLSSVCAFYFTSSQ